MGLPGGESLLVLDLHFEAKGAADNVPPVSVDPYVTVTLAGRFGGAA